MFGGLWGADKPKPTAKELIKEQKKSVRRSQREIDREMRNLEKQEKKLLGDIKKNAEKGNTGACHPACHSQSSDSSLFAPGLPAAAKTLAKELVRTRGTMT